MDQTTNGLFSPKIRKLLLSAGMGLGVLLDIFMMGCRPQGGAGSVWQEAFGWIGHPDSTLSSPICLLFVILFGVQVVLSAVGIYTVWVKKAEPLYPFGVGVIAQILMLLLSKAISLLGIAGYVWLLLNLLLMAAGVVYTIACQQINRASGKQPPKKQGQGTRRIVLLCIGGLSMVLALTLFVQPFCTYETLDGEMRSLIPLSILTENKGLSTNLLVFIVLLLICAVSFVMYLDCFKIYADESVFADKVRNVIVVNALLTGGYFVCGIIYCSLRNAKGYTYTTDSYGPFLLMIAVAMAYALTVRGIEAPAEGLQERAAKGVRLEFFIYGLIVAGITVAASLSDILKVTFTEPQNMEALRLNGLAVLKATSRVDAGFQMATFVLFAVVYIISALFLMSLISMISRSRLFYKITLAEIICGGMFTLLIGLFGKYYEIVQKMNEEVIREWIGRAIGGLVGEVGNFDLMNVEYKVKSQAFYWFIAVMGVILVILIRKPYTRGVLCDVLIAQGGALPDEYGKSNPNAVDPTLPHPEHGSVPVGSVDADPCPAFTQLDAEVHNLQNAREVASAFSFDAPTLPGIVQFVVNYARDSRLHLSYTPEDIAAFMAGLGSTRLTILQGMSGTGKTSLPKIFAEAILGRCELVEVESSWRDKNELLGYYNEFSQTYTPKKFTQALYKATLDPERFTFIVLDEMNLSRVEYYFSDFLSLMENEESKREIKLLNTGLYRIVDGKHYPYLGLTNGHTIKIPTNVWFVGTANRDESTFEISDKVYDRAHTMNFNTRAPKVRYQHEPLMSRYLSADTLLQLFEDAKNTVRFDIDSSPVVREVEELLAPYHISFGNRVANQIETFVSIYCACFAPSDAVMNEALETILLSKVVSKLEFKSVENKEQLAAEFDRLHLLRCSEFVRNLHED